MREAEHVLSFNSNVKIQWTLDLMACKQTTVLPLVWSVVLQRNRQAPIALSVVTKRVPEYQPSKEPNVPRDLSKRRRDLPHCDRKDT